MSIKSNRRRPERTIHNSQLLSLTNGDHAAVSIERRRAARHRAACGIEIKANLVTLDNDAQPSEDSLVFFGLSRDLSAGGIALVFPITSIDNRYYGENSRLQLSLQLPTGAVDLEVNPIRFVPLSDEDSALGYLIGARIVSIDDNRDEYDNYLRSIDVRL